jgi:hypothetical protein
MRRGAITLTVALALIASSLNGSFAAETDLPEKQVMVTRLQQAVRANDKAWLAAHARCPFSYFGHGKRVIHGKAAFIRNYALLFGANCARRSWRKTRRTCSRIGKSDGRRGALQRVGSRYRQWRRQPLSDRRHKRLLKGLFLNPSRWASH